MARFTEYRLSSVIILGMRKIGKIFGKIFWHFTEIPILAIKSSFGEHAIVQNGPNVSYDVCSFYSLSRGGLKSRNFCSLHWSCGPFRFVSLESFALACPPPLQL